MCIRPVYIRFLNFFILFWKLIINTIEEERLLSTKYSASRLVEKLST